MPGAAQTTTMTLEAGDYVLICFVPYAQGVPHFARGMVRELTVQ